MLSSVFCYMNLELEVAEGAHQRRLGWSLMWCPWSLEGPELVGVGGCWIAANTQIKIDFDAYFLFLAIRDEN